MCFVHCLTDTSQYTFKTYLGQLYWIHIQCLLSGPLLALPIHLCRYLCLYAFLQDHLCQLPYDVGPIYAFFHDLLRAVIVNSYTVHSFRTISIPNHTFIQVPLFIAFLQDHLWQLPYDIGHIYAFFQDLLRVVIMISYMLPSFRTISSHIHTFMVIYVCICLLTRPFMRITLQNVCI